jgi:hypothetical protein
MNPSLTGDPIMAITITILETLEGYYSVQFPFDIPVFNILRAIPGSRHDGQTRLWTIPQTKPTINTLLFALWKTGRFNQPEDEPDTNRSLDNPAAVTQKPQQHIHANRVPAPTAPPGTLDDLFNSGPQIKVTGKPAEDSQLVSACKDALRTLHYSPRTEESYLHWIRLYLDPGQLGEVVRVKNPFICLWS